MFGKESQYGTYALRAFVLRTVNGVKAQQRPQLVCEATPESIARVKKFMDERDGTRITARSVARELDGLLSYGSKMLPARPIDGGWEAQRLSFVLAVEHVSPIGVNSIYNIAGYTNRMPVQLADRIDWSGVIFYVNSCLVEHASVTRTVDGDRVHRRLEAAEHLIFDAVLASGDLTKRETRVSPSDVATHFSAFDFAGSEDVVDTRTMVTTLPRYVHRRHVLPSRFLAELMQCYFKVLEQGEDVAPDEMLKNDLVFNTMRTHLEPPALSFNSFFRALAQVQGGPFAGRFTMEDLQRVLPAVVDKGVVAFEEYTGPEEDSPVSERANQALVYLGQTIPALFHSMGFTTAQFQVDIPYHDQEDPTAFTFLNTRGFAGTMDTAERIKHVQGVMDREIFPDLRRMGLEGGSLFFNVEVFGNTSIQYNLLFGSSYQGKRHFASYADALTSPLVADSRPSSLALSADLYAVINAAADATHNDDESDPFVIWEKPVAEIETKASAYLNTLPSMSERKPEPRARTEDEVRDEFLQAFRDKAHYWATTPNGGTVKERCDRVAFSILVMLDGGSGTMPAYRVTVDPAPEDKQYCIEKGVNYYEPGTEVTNGCLHELFYRGVSD